jgi:hypothetical protein
MRGDAAGPRMRQRAAWHGQHVIGEVTEEYVAMAGWKLASGSEKSHRKAVSRAPFYTMNHKRSQPSSNLRLAERNQRTTGTADRL